MPASRRTALVVSYHAPPAPRPGARRAEQIARALAEAGWRVELVCAPLEASEVDGAASRWIDERIEVAAPNPYAAARRRLGLEARDEGGAGDAHAPKARPVPPGDRSASRASRSPVRTLARWPARAALDLLRFPDEFAGWRRPLARALRARLSHGDVDLVVTTSPPHSSTLAVRRALQGQRVPWIADFRDPWSAPRRHRRGRLSHRVHRWLERRVVRAADALVANTPGNARAWRDAFGDDLRAEVVPNGWEPDDFAGPAPPVDEACDAAYVGEVYPGMLAPWLRLLDALEAAGASVPTLRVVGPVDPRERARAETRAKAFRFDGVVSYAESIAVMRSARALVLLLPADPAWSSCVPSKLYPYLASGRPVLVLAPRGDAAAIVEEARAGLALDALAPDARAAARFFEGARAGDDGSSPERESVARRFAWPNLRAKIAALAERVVEGRA